MERTVFLPGGIFSFIIEGIFYLPDRLMCEFMTQGSRVIYPSLKFAIRLLGSFRKSRKCFSLPSRPASPRPKAAISQMDPFSSSPQRRTPLIGTWAFLPCCQSCTLASILQNHRIRNISTEHTSPTPERVPGAVIPFMEHYRITTLASH